MSQRKIIAFIVLAFVTAFMSPARSAESIDLTRIVKTIQPAVVTIIAYDINNQVTNIGTGFFVDDEGHLITNHHVLAGRLSAEVRTHDGHMFPIKFVVAENPHADLVKVWVDIPPAQIRWIKLGKDLPAIAERIIVVGSPMGLEQTVSEGIVSSIREFPQIGNFFQISAPISPGSSGSPVLNLDGQVVGVASFQFIQGQNLNFAVAAESVSELKSDGPQQTLAQWTYAQSRNKPQMAGELCRKGISFSISGEDSKALQYFKEATEKDPKNTMAWFGLGNCQAGLDNHSAAIEAFQRAIDIDPNNPLSHFNLGRYYDRLGLHDEAIETYRRVIRLNPEFEPAYFNIGVIFAKLDRYDEAKDAFESQIRINPQAIPAYYNAGLVYSHLGRYDDAIKAHQMVIRLNPEFVPSYYHLGLIYGRTARPAEEIDAYKAAIRIDPSFAPAHFQMGSALLKKGDKAAALEEYAILKKLDQEQADKLFDLIYQ